MLDINNILFNFQQLSGCSNEDLNRELKLVENAAFLVESILDESRVQEADKERCEYAAACFAFYDHACRNAGCDNIITAAEGKVSSNDDLRHRIEAALKLKNSALEGLRGLTKDNDFLFKTMGGEG